MYGIAHGMDRSYLAQPFKLIMRQSIVELYESQESMRQV